MLHVEERNWYMPPFKVACRSYIYPMQWGISIALYIKRFPLINPSIIYPENTSLARAVKDGQFFHYTDVIMTMMASQITSLTVLYSTVYSDADQSKHQSSASLAFVWGIHRDRWIPRTKCQLRGKCFHLMTSSCSSVNHNGIVQH